MVERDMMMACWRCCSFLMIKRAAELLIAFLEFASAAGIEVAEQLDTGFEVKLP